MHRGVRRPDGGGGSSGGCRRRFDAPWGRVQAAHLAVLVQGPRPRGARDPGGGRQGGGPAGGVRAHRHRSRRSLCGARGRGAGRRAQHAELRPARGGGPARQAGAAQARAVLDARRALDGCRLCAQGGQRARDPVRAWHPRDRRLVGPLSRAAAAVGADGIIVEVAPDPDAALCDGPQQLHAAGFAAFAAEVAAHAELVGRRLA